MAPLSYEKAIMKLPSLDYIFQWTDVPGKVNNPPRPLAYPMPSAGDKPRSNAGDGAIRDAEQPRPVQPGAATSPHARSHESSVVEDARFVLPEFDCCPHPPALTPALVSTLRHVTDTGTLAASDCIMKPHLAAGEANRLVSFCRNQEAGISRGKRAHLIALSLETYVVLFSLPPRVTNVTGVLIPAYCFFSPPYAHFTGSRARL